MTANSWCYGLIGLGVVAMMREDMGMAAKLYGASERMREIIGVPLLPEFVTAYEYAVLTASAFLGEAAFEVAWQEGRATEVTDLLAAFSALSFPSPTNESDTPATLPPDAPQSHTAASTARILPNNLTPREADVLRLIAAGLSNAAIADSLVLSIQTVKTYLKTIYSKIGVSSRSAATRYALEHGLF